MRFQDNTDDRIEKETAVASQSDKTTATNTLSVNGSRIGSTKDQILHDFHLPEAPDDIPLNEGQRLVAIGDIHGNYPLLLNILVNSRLVDRPEQPLQCNDLRWTGTNSIVVFVGDILDRGDDEEKCLRVICSLAQQAKIAGGTIVCLWGNHESMNTEGRFECVGNDQAFLETFSAVLLEENEENKPEDIVEPSAKKPKMDPLEMRKKVFAQGGLLAKAFLSNLKVAVKVGRSVLVHAGLVKRHLDHFGGGIHGLAAMNKAGTEWICTVNQDPPFLDCLDLPVFSSEMDIDQGPQWMRDYSNSKELTADSKRKVDDVLQCLHVDRIVVGHTIQSVFGGVNSTYEAKVWRVDIGTGAQDGFSMYRPETAFKEDSEFLYNLAMEVTLNEGREDAQIVRREANWLHT